MHLHQAAGVWNASMNQTTKILVLILRHKLEFKVSVTGRGERCLGGKHSTEQERGGAGEGTAVLKRVSCVRLG
jgi:hypothetical protein